MNGSPSVALLFIGCVVAALIDRQYIKSGGKKPTTQDYGLFAVACGVCLFSQLWWGIVWGASAEFEATLTWTSIIVLFSTWEFARWRVRRKNPLRKAVK